MGRYRSIRILMLAAVLLLSFGTAAAFAKTQALVPASSAGYKAFQKYAKGVYSSYDTSANALLCSAAYNAQICSGSGSSSSVVKGKALSEEVKIKNKQGTIDLLGSGRENSFLFKMNTDASKNKDAVQIRYKNYYYYDPSNAKALKSGSKTGYVKIDILATVSACTYVKWRKPESRAYAPYIAIRKKLSAGMPKVEMINTGRLQIAYTFYYAGTSTQISVKSNLTYLDIDCGQAMAFKASSVPGAAVMKKSVLGYSYSDGWHLFSNIKNNSASNEKNPENAVSICYKTGKLHIRYYSNQRSEQKDGTKYYTEGKPSGALAYFAPAQKYTMLNPGSPPKPVKTVTYDKQKDKTSVSVPDMEQTFVFSCKTVIPPGYQPAYYFKSMILTDKLEDCLTTSLKDISVVNENGKSLTHLFDLTLNGQTVQAKAKAGSAGLGNSALYNGGAGQTVILLIPARFKEGLTEEVLEQHGHFQGESRRLTFLNDFTQNISGTLQTSNQTSVRVELPEPDPVVEIEKSSDRQIYHPGETGLYTIKVRQIDEDAVERQVVLRDLFDEVEKVKVDMDSIQVLWNDQDITEACDIRSLEGGYTIYTGRDLSSADELTVSYKVLFNEDTEDGDTIHNVVMEQPEDKEKERADDPFEGGGDYPTADNTVQIVIEVPEEPEPEPPKPPAPVTPAEPDPVPSVPAEEEPEEVIPEEPIPQQAEPEPAPDPPAPERPDSPDTGDHTDLILFLITFATAVTAVIVLTVVRRKDGIS